MATHPSVLAWRTPGTGEPGGLLSMGSHRVGRGLAAAAAATLNIMQLLSVIIVKPIEATWKCSSKLVRRRLPWLPSDKESTCLCRRGGLDPWLESIPHAAEQLSPLPQPDSPCVHCALSHIQLCDPTDCSPPGSPVHGILQARILEWVAISFSSA